MEKHRYDIFIKLYIIYAFVYYTMAGHGFPSKFQTEKIKHSAEPPFLYFIVFLKNAKGRFQKNLPFTNQITIV
jgi:hypothetical protein